MKTLKKRKVLMAFRFFSVTNYGSFLKSLLNYWEGIQHL